MISSSYTYPPPVLFDQIGGMYVFFWFPTIVCRGETFPFNKVLQSFCSPGVSVGHYGLDFVFQLFVDQIRRRPQEVGAVFFCLLKRGEERRMENRVDPPCRWKV
jgi:hypothetical protein